ncbi:dihydrolipoamide acetyltransferase family protein [Oscillatoria acuminata]|uniref:Dihydrolipoamide acetyltransferase component of pyruvate dehydrogenase complex n=1 Tax=Oscillatoria acuminata PCC 6304 TaxID=56110 RepID=K9TBA6_9CYAN|nr:dihydrolipoamide acetyltransferase family protein [Oscillatoria acuminata]AFY79795.1 pyruvate/2-oxoglutarate dehydrogenase complex, dihydrolipoamide acyltransferase component [Oscillatoria acuminata PCC 6304]
MINEVFMPALSSTMTEGKIVSWEKAPGDKVEKGETVVVVESDKADMDVESFYEGYLATILVQAGEAAPVGAAIALLAETEAEIEQAKQQGANLSNKSAQPAAAPQSTPSPAPEPAMATAGAPASRQNGRTVASPRAKKLAKEYKVDLATLSGSGPFGRIVAEDVEAAAGKAPAATATPAQPTVAAPPRIPTQAVPPAASGDVVPFNTLQNAVVRNMVASLQVPIFHVGYTITTDQLDKLYKQIKSKGVTMTALLAKAVALTLQKHPLLNASCVDGGIQHHGNINIAVAVAMGDGGLITPVLQNADQMDIYSLSRTWKDLVERARVKQLQPAEYNSGTFTLSNLGMYGVDSFDAILPPGQGSILAIGGAKNQVVATDDGMMGVRRQMRVNITCDHRIIYGADAAAFLQDLAKLIETDAQSLTM